MKQCLLSQISIGETAEILKINSDAAMRRRFLDIGLTCGTQIKCLHQSPCGDPRAYLSRGAVIAIRNSDAGDITVIRGEKNGTI